MIPRLDDRSKIIRWGMGCRRIRGPSRRFPPDWRFIYGATKDRKGAGMVKDERGFARKKSSSVTLWSAVQFPYIFKVIMQFFTEWASL
jgi:hypothetical protein